MAVLLSLFNSFGAGTAESLGESTLVSIDSEAFGSVSRRLSGGLFTALHHAPTSLLCPLFLRPSVSTGLVGLFVDSRRTQPTGERQHEHFHQCREATCRTICVDGQRVLTASTERLSKGSVVGRNGIWSGIT